jgi:hypothetical protein
VGAWSRGECSLGWANVACLRTLFALMGKSLSVIVLLRLVIAFDHCAGHLRGSQMVGWSFSRSVLMP